MTNLDVDVKNPNLNRENLETFITYLEGVPPEKFHMSAVLSNRISSECGTIGCIKGWGAICQITNAAPVTLDFVQEDLAKPYWEAFDTQNWLGLSGPQADRLFFPEYSEEGLDNKEFGWSTCEDAILLTGAAAKSAVLTELRYLLETGEV